MNGGGRVTVNQVGWIFGRASDFMVRWVGNPPADDQDWAELMGQAHDLMERGRNHPLLMVVMVDILNYLGGEAGGKEKLLDEDKGAEGLP